MSNIKSKDITKRLQELCEEKRKTHPEEFNSDSQVTEEPVICGGIAWTETKPLEADERDGM